MYTRITRSGGRAYLQLVEAYRNDAGKPRQKVIATLGRLDQLSDQQLEPLIKGLQRALGREPAALPPIEYESSKVFGDLFALDRLWSQLGLDRALRRCFRGSRRKIDVEGLIRVMVFNRLANPDSKLGVLRWLDEVAMPRLPKGIVHDHLLRAMDTLMDQAASVEQAVCDQLTPLLGASVSVVFYDLTTLRIEGEGRLEDDLRQYGRSKDGGTARQVMLGVVQSAEGLPLMHEVHAGNQSETKTLKPMLDRVLERFSVERMIIVADRGLLSVDNLDHFQALAAQCNCQLEFILAVPARRYGELGDQIAAIDASSGLGEADFKGHRMVVAYDAQAAEGQRQ